MSADLPTWTPFDPDRLPRLPFPVGGGGRVVALVASPGALEEGWAGAVAIDLARGWASLGERVLLVDTGLAAPSLHLEVGLENGEGLSEALHHGGAVHRSARPVDSGAFYLVTAGRIADDPRAAFRSDRWSRLCRAFSDAGVTLLAYCPAVVPWQAAVVVAADACILLASEGEAPRVPRGSMPPLIAILGQAGPSRDAARWKAAAAGSGADSATGPGVTTEPEIPATPSPLENLEFEAELARAWDERVEFQKGPGVDPLEDQLVDPLALDPPLHRRIQPGPAPLPAQQEDRRPELGRVRVRRAPSAIPLRPPLKEKPRRARPGATRRFGNASRAAAGVGVALLLVAGASTNWFGFGRADAADEPAAAAEEAQSAAAGPEMEAGPGVDSGPGGTTGPGMETGPGVEAVGPTPVPSDTSATPPPIVTADALRARWSVSIASYQSADLATRLAEELVAQTTGIWIAVVPVRLSGVVYHRVLAGLEGDSLRAEAFKETLGRSTGRRSDGWLVRSAGTAFQLAESASRAVAEQAVAAARARGVPAYVFGVPGPGGATLYHVYAGAFGDLADATYLGEVIAGNGLTASLTERRGSPPR